MGIDRFRFDGKRVLVVGGATGMGAAAAALVQELGADVVVMDHTTITLAGATAVHVDLRDQASIDAALDTAAGWFDVVFSCAGAADGTPGIEKINFIGHRHLIERLLAAGRLPRGSAIGMISSHRRPWMGGRVSCPERVSRHAGFRLGPRLDRGPSGHGHVHLQQTGHERLRLA